jgi:hypothetical protein
VIEVTTAKHILKPMVVIKPMANRALCLYIEKFADSWPLQYEVRDGDDSMETLRKRNQPKTLSIPEGIYAYEYVEVNYDFISKFYVNQLAEVSKLHFV